LASLRVENRVAVLELADPAKRNALGLPMFDALQAALQQAHELVRDVQTGDVSVAAMLLCGQGPSFCGGFDLAACAQTPQLLRPMVERLSAAVQAVRALPMPVVAQVQGAALAGGCALVAGCDFVHAAADAQMGYPVHRIGVSPTVTLPALMANAGAGRAREITMGGAVYSGAEAVRVGLATHLVPAGEDVAAHARAMCERLAKKGPHALRATKAWLNELDGSQDSTRFAHAAAASAAAAEGDEFATLLRTFWK
jgi:methylglutaconyl-CoA hydratase